MPSSGPITKMRSLPHLRTSLRVRNEKMQLFQNVYVLCHPTESVLRPPAQDYYKLEFLFELCTKSCMNEYPTEKVM